MYGHCCCIMAILCLFSKARFSSSSTTILVMIYWHGLESSLVVSTSRRNLLKTFGHKSSISGLWSIHLLLGFNLPCLIIQGRYFLWYSLETVQQMRGCHGRVWNSGVYWRTKVGQSEKNTTRKASTLISLYLGISCAAVYSAYFREAQVQQGGARICEPHFVLQVP